MSFLFNYIKQHKAPLLILFVFLVIYWCAFLLYELPLGAVLYPTIICVVLGAIALFLDVRKAQKKHRELSKWQETPLISHEQLPPAKTQDDVDYQAILETLDCRQRKLQTDLAQNYQDMVDYYTIWAHQIKTPIASMRLTLQNEDSPLSRQIAEDLQRIEQYVEMVLAFLRLDASTKDYVFRKQDLDPIVRDAIKKFKGSFIRKKIRLCYEPLHAQVLTDEKWLSFVLEQVLSNALKYTNVGEIAITLEEPLTLVIRDTGIGIAPEDLPRVFEKSYTGYNGRSDKKASGIGLYLCRRICENLGHTITIQSVLDEGTEVRLDLSRRSMQVE